MTRQTRSGRAGLIAGCLTALFLNGCGANSYQPTTPPPVAQPSPTPTPIPTPAPSVVVIEVVAINGNMSFVPATANLQVGQQVRWHNAHSVSHTATQDGGGFDTGLISPGATSAPITVSTPGTLSYHCEIHPSMVGALNATR